MAKLYYLIHYPTDEPWDAWWETNIKNISPNEKTVRDMWDENVALKAEEEEISLDEATKDYSTRNRIDIFDTDVTITGDSVWVVFDYSCFKDVDKSRIAYVGNTLEECLAWWDENWNIYLYGDDSSSQAPKFDTTTMPHDGLIYASYPQYRSSYGIRIEKVKLS